MTTSEKIAKLDAQMARLKRKRYILQFGMDTRKKRLRFTHEFVSQLDRCADDLARMILIRGV